RPQDWRRLASLLRRLNDRRFAGALEAAAECAFEAQDYSDAAAWWEKSGAAKGRDYWFAKAQTSTGVEQARWLDRLGEYGGILDAWRKAQRPLGDGWLDLARRAMQHNE